jgi:hypothetical protein
MKRDSQADELADQWTLLPGERKLSANKSGTTRRFAVLLKFFRSEARFPPVASGSPQSVFVRLEPYFAPGDTNVFARPASPIRRGETMKHEASRADPWGTWTEHEREAHNQKVMPQMHVSAMPSMRMFTVSRERANPDSSITKPTCMQKTR